MEENNSINSAGTDTQTELDSVWEALRGVVDPELGLDIVALGLVYDVRLEGDRVIIEMTLTTPGCPVSESLPDEAYYMVREALGPERAERVDVRVVWDPPWTPERMRPEAAALLGFG
ncbi:MAG: metal-sulfur cluster assembly factor [Actinobacteria bacterium]|jgi:metal-sulfur cluster biosynthetic enzyme|nr:metal-sulfur cluster assembly factor [Actinomycetota bacterium]MCL6095609.1 metal-sulfur cluster assembly factor [Actinomycetota bacterium]